VDPNSTVRVIVQYKQTTPAASQTGLLGGVLNLVSAVVGDVLNLVNAVVCTVSGSSISTLANDPNVSYISPDRAWLGNLITPQRLSMQVQPGKPR
jgi:hypothetical protein